MKRRELITFLICFLGSYVLNIVGIILYKSPVIELVSQLHIVLLIAVVFYLSILILRGIYYTISKLLMGNI